ncbi:hypothetical protein L1987_36424 [Smallanthus sonchifolius]|uniref:Uncharacterized protein n=1 Tax=Smallanthus sonchifolius TaxID=185202 RepID=A0ACB9HE04_9ASTR|nr:hypothetical protein L1987_36424 [Smallanthus sonchifolius]
MLFGRGKGMLQSVRRDGCSITHHDDGRQVDGSPRDSNVQAHVIGEGNASCGESFHANPNRIVMTGSHPHGNSIFYFNPGEKKSQKGKRFKHASRSKGSPSPTMPWLKKWARPDDDPFGLNKLLGLSSVSEPPSFNFSFPPSVLSPPAPNSPKPSLDLNLSAFGGSLS